MKRLLLCLAATVFATALPVKIINADRATYGSAEYFGVVIDAGHGGIDGGAVGVDSGALESDINLEIAKTLKDVLVSRGIRVTMTRTGADGLYGLPSKGFKLRDLSERVKTTERAKADALVSIHLNEYRDRNRRGAQVFYRVGDEISERLAKCVQARLNGLETNTRDYAALGGDYYILNETHIPAIICECGFLSNAEDEKLLLSPEYRKRLAMALFDGLTDFFASENS